MVNRKRQARRMTRLVAEWRASGESQERFARRRHVRPWTLWYWSRKVRREAPPVAPMDTPRFVPVQVAPEPGAAPVEILLADGVRIHLRPDAPAALVQAALAAVRAC